MATKIFIDGEHGTTGLQIQKRLAARSDLELLSIPHVDRHNIDLRYDYFNQADIAILCLPDDAARETIKLLKNNKKIRIIDSSTAHRTATDWVYGFPEMTAEQKKCIQAARYVANPGCYATGAISLLRPLREAGLLDAHYPISINAVSGYTGGGKLLIAQIENQSQQDSLQSNYFVYGLNLKHKHLSEIKIHGWINKTPIFVPSVGRFPQGMIVNLPLHRHLFTKSANCSNLREIFKAHYEGQNIVSIASQEETETLTRLDPECLAHKDNMKIFVFGDEREGIFNLCAVLDNLGKGASAAAVQNLNLMLLDS
ncbi:N-acetyl-gamma-glutamyl-phosphate reductase [Bartonella bacilliformis Peru38]|uniref:N-acetyl-gamma-glutamyl-phosphate reductase n=2 Tax=Bartonella bacilliformis TaxID=774 RepID=A1USH9_BARBK|nr:N-acetyl-gamma-glutamyl-phosphate reductase [Bartonella bacilliformis]ABM45027.1 N-acetyl-gamma-glutamyl-phosphate reductase [Bartonella bacilliformis KC583]AMG85750.1 N-acetyl-gamma-glutamyl-phosphate reductase [Bartonella bacilliformis]EKS44535.1 N-acetyl-gamma-glutamyl-phosphate reductase [Bartonella bacilliformis INS]EYS89817.1 N-acetyl-gamma-glutamyl-phosphate reductase [Bartonella bacilliformis San Pedro600-02]EYS95159.1 N-acetyl-gamma-glutamyl-phosphate reductase [Bartonella bacillif